MNLSIYHFRSLSRSYRVVLMVLLACVYSTPAQAMIEALQENQNGSEHQWIVSHVGKTIAVYLYFVKYEKAPEGVDSLSVEVHYPKGNKGKTTLVFHIEGNTIECPVEFQPSVWTPQSYATVVAQLANAMGVTPSNPSNTSKKPLPLVAKVLLDSQDREIWKLDDELSALLADHSKDAQWYTAAALLNSFLPVRDFNSWIWDARQSLNHSVALLALADFFSDQSSMTSSRLIADVLWKRNAGFAAEAVKDNQLLLSSGDPVLKEWGMLMDLIIRGDYRAPIDTEASYARKVAHIMARSNHQHNEIALKAAIELKPKPQMDAVRVLLAGQYSVGFGHDFAVGFAGSALNLLQYFMYEHGMKSGDEAIIDLMNRNHPLGDTLRAVPFAQWASYYERFFINALIREYGFYHYKWSHQEKARSFAKKYHQRLSGLPRIYEMPSSFFGEDGEKTRSTLMGKTIRSKPHLMNITNWSEIYPDLPWALRKELIDVWPYVEGTVPHGTAYDAGRRFQIIGYGDMNAHEKKVLARLKAINPYDMHLLKYAKKVLPRPYNAYDILDCYGEFTEYNGLAVSEYLDALKSDPEAYEVFAVSKMDMFPQLVRRVALYMQDRDAHKAASYWERYFNTIYDNVAKANDCEWLINYYWDHGKKDLALDMAAFAKEVYSYDGLMAYARLMIKAENWDEGQSVAQACDVRYNKEYPDAVLDYYGFAIRGETPDTIKDRYTNEILKLEDKYIEKDTRVTLEGLKADNTPPPRGLYMHYETEPYLSQGLTPQEVVIAVEGRVIENLIDMRWILQSLPHSEPALILWNKETQTYQELKLKLTQTNYIYGNFYVYKPK